MFFPLKNNQTIYTNERLTFSADAKANNNNLRNKYIAHDIVKEVLKTYLSNILENQ